MHSMQIEREEGRAGRRKREREGERDTQRERRRSWIFEELLCSKGKYLNCMGKESRVIHFTNKNEMFTERANLFLQRSITKCLRGMRVGGFIDRYLRRGGGH